MTHSSKQINCSHWDLGRYKGVCGELGSCSMRNSLLDYEKLFNSDMEALPKLRDNSPTPGADATANLGLC